MIYVKSFFILTFFKEYSALLVRLAPLVFRNILEIFLMTEYRWIANIILIFGQVHSCRKSRRPELSKNPLSHSTLLRFSPLGGTASDEEWRVDSNFDLLPSFRTTDSEAPLLAEVKISKTIKIEMILAIRPYFYC